jgi:hypothetical protein
VLSNGVWNGLLTVMQPAAGVFLVPDDGNGHSGASSVFAVLTNHPPVVNSLSIVMNEDTLQPITLTASDPDGDTLIFGFAIPPTNGILVGPELSYAPNGDYWGPDNFFFSVNDGKGNSVTGQVSITVISVTDLGYSRLSLQHTNGQLQLGLLGEPYERYRIEASQDLVLWTTLTNLMPRSTFGPLPFIDPDASLYSYRFYRSVLVGAAPQLSSARFLAGGEFQLDLAANVGRRCEVSASTNLTDWVALTNLIMTEPALRVIDTSAGDFPRRFYRARVLP